MIHLSAKVPQSIYLAFSGGVDSLAAAHFFKAGRKDVHLLHFNHGCEHSDVIEKQCVDRAESLGLRLTVGTIPVATPPRGMSLEEHWRQQRYAFLNYYAARDYKPFVLCHHLDDAVETWVWSSLHGEGKIIPVVRGQWGIRPFLLTEKQDLIGYAEKHGLKAVHDPYNEDYELTRNYIRRNLLPHAYYVNPGLKKVIRKKYLNHG